MSCAWLDGARADRVEGGQAAMRFGKRVRFEGRPETESLNLTHRDGPRGFSGMEKAEKGLATTRFRRGFQRRQATSIGADVDRKANEAARAARSAQQVDGRRHALGARAAYNGFDVISGDYDPTKVRGQRPQARYLSDRLSGELVRAGEITLRNSGYRFYTPHPTGRRHDSRQDKLLREGLLKPKFSSVLGVGRSEAASFGVEDQFSKAKYQPELKGMPSLVDTLEPGKYPAAADAARPRLFAGTWRHDDDAPRAVVTA